MQVRVKNLEFGKDVWKFAQPEFFDFEGEEVNLKHAKPDELALSTGDPEWPVRVLKRSQIVSINGVAHSTTSDKILTRTVKGSKGETYTVSRTARGRWSCTCQGFQFRNTCRHIKEVSENG